MRGVYELRVALTVANFDEAVRLYREGLGLQIDHEWDNPPGRGIVLPAGRATIELLDQAQAELVDRMEVGRRAAGPIRLALGVDDTALSGGRLRDLGAEVVHDPVLTPWGDLNMRLRTPEGVQITLFQGPK